MKSLYIHIPFCAQRCWYCDFNSYSGKDELIEEYVETLKKEIQSYSLKSLETIYFGGGTPSYINEKYIEKILNLCNFNNAEITLEVNPGTVNKKKLEAYYRMGINRLSIGLQATQNNILKEIGRIHSLEDFEKTYLNAREVGFQNINVDLMFGLPNQTVQDVKDSLNYILKINPEHISCYSLILHNETTKKLPTDEEEREMYHTIVNTLKEDGYHHYEISNFARSGYESKHNLVYWNQEEYVGVGAGASSYVNGVRYTNVADIKKYINGEKPNIEEVQTLNSKEREYIILQLRLVDGMNIAKANKRFSTDIEKVYKSEIDKMKKLDLLTVENGYMKLTTKGLDFGNVVWEEFIS